MACLAFTIIPRLAFDSDGSIKLVELLGHMETLGVRVEPVLPMMLHLAPQKTQWVVEKLRQSIVAQDGDKVTQSCIGITRWLRFERWLTLPPMPRDLLHEMGHLVSGRRKFGLREAMRMSAEVVFHRPDVLDSHYVWSLQIGLKYLLKELNYHDGLASADIVHSRVACAILARQLINAGHSDDSTVKWIEEASNDSMLTVRRAARSDTVGSQDDD